MVSENLSVKITADVSALQNGLKKVKKSLSDMTGEVKKSLPRINTESKKAEVSLKEVSEAGDDVTKSLKKIGMEVKNIGNSSIEKLEKSLSNISVIGGKTNFDLNKDSIDEADSSVNNLQDSLSALTGITALDFVARGFDKIGEAIQKSKQLRTLKSEFGDAFDDYKDAIVNAQVVIKKAFDEGAITVEQYSAEMDKLHKKYAEMVDEQARVEKAIKDANKNIKASFKDTFKEITGITVSAALKIAAVIGTIIGSFLALRSAIRTANLGGEIYNSAQRAGMATETYQRWTFILERNGIAIDELTEIMSTLTEAQVDVIDGTEDMIKAFGQLGMTQDEVINMNQEQLWESTITALQGVENKTERVALAYKIFGEDASKLTTILNMNAEEAARLNNVYYQLGGNMSQNLIRLSAEYRASMTNLKTAFQGVKNTIAEALLPAIIAVINWVTKAVAIVGMFLRTVFGINLSFKSANKTISTGASSIKKYGDSATGATKAIEKLKRTTMGFDELNIVQNPNSSAGSSGGGAGAADVGGADYGAGISAADPLIDVEDLGLEKWQEWFNKYKKIIQDVTTWSLIGIGAIGAVLCFMSGNWVGGIAFAAMAGLGIAVGSVEGGTFDRLAAHIKNIWADLKTTFGKLVDFFKGAWDKLKGFGIAAWKGIKGDWSIATDFFKSIFDGIITIFSGLGTWFANLFTGAWNGIKNAWSGVSAWFSTLLNGIKNVWNSVSTWFSNLFANAWNGIKSAWSSVTSWFSSIWAGIKNAFSSVGTWFSSIFNTAWTNIKKAFSNWKTFFTGLWNDVKAIFKNVGTAIGNAVSDTVKSAVNKILSTVVSKINTFIGAINTAIKVINAIPGVNIKSISKLSVPKLATGGIVTSSTLANIGEAGAEMVLPLTGSQSTAWMDMLSTKIADRIAGGSQQKIVLQVGERELGWATIGAINGITKQTGGLQLAL